MSAADGSDLPPALLDALFRILYGAPARRAADLAALRAANPEQHAAIDAHVARAAAEATAAADTATGEVGDTAPPWQPRRHWTLGPGVVFAGYRIVAELGSGGMGSVFAAERVADRQRVALKILHQDVLDRRDARQRFKREVQALARLRHPGICEPIEDGVLEGCPYLVMRLIEGPTLAERIAAAKAEPTSTASPHEPLLTEAMVRGLLPDQNPRGMAPHTAAVLAMVEVIAEALQAAHEQGVLHRDVKPGNVLLEPDGHPVLVDFGLAVHDTADTLTASDDLLGTPAYMPPECITGTSEPDARGDVYSLGVMLFECLTLRLPFTGVSQADLLRAITGNEPPPLLRELQPDRPKAIERVVAAAIDRDPAFRYGSARDLAADLARLRRGEPLQARRSTPWRTVRDWVLHNRTFSTTAGIGLLTAGLLSGLALDVAARQRDADLLASPSVVGMARSAEATLWPATPDKRSAFIAWLERFADQDDPDSLPTRLRRLEQVCGRSASTLLAEARADAEAALRTQIDEERAALRRIGPVAAPDAMTTVEIEDYRQRRSAWLDQEAPPEAPKVAARPRTAHEAALLALARYVLDDTDAPGSHGAIRRVRQGLEWLRRVEQTNLAEPREAWQRVAAAVASGKPPYETPFELGPQFGLVPLGPDPDSQLEEFAVPASGTVPTRDERGRLVPRDDMAIVLVLIPGGATTIGTAAIDRPLEVLAFPAHRVAIDPFFLGKYEVTRRQWRELGGGEPSRLRTGSTFFGESIGDRHPLENVALDAARLVVQRFGLALPTEGQWEHAARAGQTPAAIRAMVRDAGENSAGGERGHRPLPPFVADDHWDGRVLPTPVGAHPANPWGLHDCGGNVSEWCDDVFAPYWFPPRKGDGRRLSTWGALGVARGPNFALNGEVWSRMPIRTEVRLPVLGLRVARAID